MLFTEADSSSLTHDVRQFKTLKINNSNVFDVCNKCNNTTLLKILFYHAFFFFLIIDLYFLITAVIGEVFIATAKPTIVSGIATKEAKAEMETHPASVGVKISMFLNIT